VRIIWTRHAEERQKEWEKKLRITRDEVESLINSPAQVVSGDMGILVAQTKTRDGLLRVPFARTGDSLRIITVYWTSRIEKYWEGKSEDKI
jgi:hypothetical protein